jgi:hypothetical protein
MGRCDTNLTYILLITCILLFIVIVLLVTNPRLNDKNQSVMHDRVPMRHRSSTIQPTIQPTIDNNVTIHTERGLPDPYIPPMVRSGNINYQQIGILTRNDIGETILPLMGRELYRTGGKWNYYTMNDKNNMVRLPIQVNGKSGTAEYGCDQLYSNDSVYVQGYNTSFTVTIYETSQIHYSPF